MWRLWVFVIGISAIFWFNKEPEPTIDKSVFVEAKTKSQWYYVLSRIKESETLSERLFYKGMLKDVEDELKTYNICVKQTYNSTNFERCI